MVYDLAQIKNAKNRNHSVLVQPIIHISAWSNPQNLSAGLWRKIFDSNLSFDQRDHKKSPNLPVARDF